MDYCVKSDTPKDLGPEQLMEIERTLSSLDPREREVLLLVDVEGYSYGEAAEILGITEAALTSRVSRARQAFATLWNGDGSE